MNSNGQSVYTPQYNRIAITGIQSDRFFRVNTENAGDRWIRRRVQRRSLPRTRGTVEQLARIGSTRRRVPFTNAAQWWFIVFLFPLIDLIYYCSASDRRNADTRVDRPRRYIRSCFMPVNLVGVVRCYSFRPVECSHLGEYLYLWICIRELNLAHSFVPHW